jgi:cytochrome P450
MKNPSFYASFVARHNSFVEVDKDLHRQRKKALSPAFSKSNISSMQPLLFSKIDALCQKLSRMEDLGRVNIHNAFRLASMIIVGNLM